MAIQDHVPIWANMKASFVIDGSQMHLDRIEFDTDGAKTTATGDVDLRNWPEQSYQVKSRVQFPRMRQSSSRTRSGSCRGEGDFTGTFHLFKGDGRDLTGTFSSAMLGVNDYRFPSLYGSLHWTRELFDVHDAGAKLFGGDAGSRTRSDRSARRRRRPRGSRRASATSISRTSPTSSS